MDTRDLICVFMQGGHLSELLQSVAKWQEKASAVIQEQHRAYASATGDSAIDATEAGDDDLSFLAELDGLSPIPPASKVKEFKNLLKAGQSLGVAFDELERLASFCQELEWFADVRSLSFVPSKEQEDERLTMDEIDQLLHKATTVTALAKVQQTPEYSVLSKITQTAHHRCSKARSLVEASKSYLWTTSGQNL